MENGEGDTEIPSITYLHVLYLKYIVQIIRLDILEYFL